MGVSNIDKLNNSIDEFVKNTPIEEIEAAIDRIKAMNIEGPTLEEYFNSFEPCIIEPILWDTTKKEYFPGFVNGREVARIFKLGGAFGGTFLNCPFANVDLITDHDFDLLTAKMDRVVRDKIGPWLSGYEPDIKDHEPRVIFGTTEL